MKVLFIHTNFPAQFQHLAAALRAEGHEVRAIGSKTARAVAGVEVTRYAPPRGTTPDLFVPATRYEADCIRGAAVAAVCAQMAAQGYTPDLIFGHHGWGETLFVRDVWPYAKLAVYAEFHTRPQGLDVDFDPEFPRLDLAGAIRVRAKGGSVLLALLEADFALSPTHFQASTFPAALRSKIEVCHEGVDTREVRPNVSARFAIPDSDIVLKPGDPVVTYVNRNMEPMRGLHIFTRAVPAILAARPDARIIVIGADNPTPYGLAPPQGQSWREIFFKEIAGKADLSRVHILGRVSRPLYLQALQVSAAHVYLTYPFVLSWSLLEAMAAQCMIIASRTAPVMEALSDQRNGLLVDFFDHAGLAQLVVKALDTPAAYWPLREQARRDAIARYDLHSVCLPRLLALAHAWGGAGP
jgi:glycosyltransferase involved in cell wall biosynthesis